MDVRQNSAESFGPLEDVERRIKDRFEAIIEQPTGWVGSGPAVLVAMTMTQHNEAPTNIFIFRLIELLVVSL